MSEEENKKPGRIVPQNDLDFNFQLTNPTWGKKGDISKETNDNLKKVFYVVDEEGNMKTDGEGNPVIHHEDNYWSKIGFLTRDFRLSNLDKGDYKKLVWWTEFATAVSLLDYKRSTAYCIVQTAPTLELSQSKNGWMRESNNTLIQKNTNTTEEPNKKSLFGMGKK